MRASAPRARRGLAHFIRDCGGVSAVEFALIAPFLILTYFGMAELSGAIISHRRVAHAASAIGDLVAQDDKVTTSEMTDIFSSGTVILSPYSATPLKMRITSITGDSNGNPKVDWSAVPTGQTVLTAYAAGASVTLPTGLITAQGDNVVMSEATYTYDSPVKYVLKNALSFNEKFYLRPRKVAKVIYPST